MAWGKKLLLSLSVFAIMLRERLPGGSKMKKKKKKKKNFLFVTHNYTEYSQQ